MGDLSGFEKSRRKTSFQSGTWSFLGPFLLEQIIDSLVELLRCTVVTLLSPFACVPQVSAALP